MYQLNDDYPVEVKIRIFAGQVYAGAELGSWCLSPEKELYYSTCPHEAEFLSMFRLNGCLDYANTKEVWDKPVFLSDDLGMVWIAESMYVNWGSAPLCMIGPFFYNNVSIRHIDAQLRKNISSIPVRREMMRVLETVPVLTVATAYQYAAMMHFTLTDHMISSTDFYFQNDIVSDTELKDYYDEDVDESESVQEYGEDTAVNFEERLMLAISEGSPAYKELLSKASSYSDDMLTESGDSMRDAKNTLLIFNALACRAANKGGLPVRSAREIEKKYKEKIESCGNVGDTHEIMNRMVKEYVDSVAYTHENEQISKNIRECCDYIRNNVQKNLTVNPSPRKWDTLHITFQRSLIKKWASK